MLRVSPRHACPTVLLPVPCAHDAPLTLKRQDGSLIDRKPPAGRRKGDSVCHTISRTSCPTLYNAFGEAESSKRSALFNGMNVQTEFSGTLKFPTSLYGPYMDVPTCFLPMPSTIFTISRPYLLLGSSTHSRGDTHTWSLLKSSNIFLCVEVMSSCDKPWNPGTGLAVPGVSFWALFDSSGLAGCTLNWSM
ncbi:uncharacterized protein CCOS01_16961 [Colletotrichum costaricense]|uniref:Uncharacterized protein n=1 Tax=Colletotrichum costaricense TaxID=1209916 RepID=A0AAI9YEH8_9PEZI|nr:uncharacterized protein CCOS01_16961 [Colletotrichum costaricense]KAK1503886.1 hypothetical protein CCOS01_16961 [Colletotrichum costaricense]